MMLVAGAINAWDYLYNDKEVHIAYLAVFGVTVLLSLICFVLSMVRASILKKFKRECRMRNDMISDKVSKILEKSGTTCKSKSELISVMQNRMAEEVTEKGLKDQLKTYNDQIDARMLKLASLTCDVISYGSQYGMNNKIKDEVTDVFLRDMSSPVNIAAILIDGKQDGASYDIEKGNNSSYKALDGTSDRKSKWS